MLSQKKSQIKINSDGSKLKPYITTMLNNQDGSDVFKLKVIATPIGSLVAVSDEQDLLMLENLDSKHLDRDMKRLKTHSKLIVEDETATPLRSIESELVAYFKGELTEFKTQFRIDSTETEFQRSVWNAIHKIEYGKTSNYTKLAQAIGNPKSYRAVANACGRNPIAVMIPCHRVLASGDGLGGYSSGIEKKVWLLDHEKKYK